MKNLLIKIFVSSGLASLCYRFFHKPCIVFFHDVVNNEIDRRIEPTYIHTPIDIFDKKIKFLKKHCDVVSIDMFYDRLITDKLNGKEVVITFDDGYINNLLVAAPLLKSLELPFTVFICTHNVETQQMFNYFWIRASIHLLKGKDINLKSINKSYSLSDEYACMAASKSIINLIKEQSQDVENALVRELLVKVDENKKTIDVNKFNSEKLLNWDQVRQLMEEYNCTIGSHCHHHFVCNPQQSKEDIHKEFEISKLQIEKVQGSCRYLAYPNGNVTQEAMETAQECGYSMAFATENTPLPTNKFSYRRFDANGNLNSFIARFTFYNFYN